MNKEEIDNLIDRLADKTLSFGCKVKADGHGHPLIIGSDYSLDVVQKTLSTVRFCDDCPPTQKFVIREIFGHPVMLGDVLERIEKAKSLSICKMVLNFWGPCGFALSLQQIVERSGWETGFETPFEDLSTDEPLKPQVIEQLNSKPARQLFDTINSLINE